MKVLGVSISKGVLFGVVIGIFIGMNLVGSCSRVSPREAFTVLGAPVGEQPTADVYGNWISRPVDHVRNPHETIKEGRHHVESDHLDILADNVFSPECCANDMGYSSSTGCACITSEQRHMFRNARPPTQ